MWFKFVLLFSIKFSGLIHSHIIFIYKTSRIVMASNQIHTVKGIKLDRATVSYWAVGD